MDYNKHHRSLDSIRDKATKYLGLKRTGIFYTKEEIQFVKDNYPIKGAQFCAEYLGVSVACVSDLATKRLGLKRHGIKYTKEEIQFVKDNYPAKGAQFCADYLGVSRAAASDLATKRLGLKRFGVRTGKRQVYCLELDMTFESSNAAERYMCQLLNLKRYHLTEGLKSGKSVSGYHWQFVDKE